VKHAGKAQVAAFRLILLSLGLVLAVIIIGFLAQTFGAFVLGLSVVLIVLWILFSIFTFYFFRDPDANVPIQKGLVVSPGHGKVDAVGTTTEAEFMGGECQRVSIFLSVINVHVQNVPVSGRVGLCKHTAGQYLNALSADSAKFNENVLIGFECADPANEKVGIRLIAGLIARRIIPWVTPGETVARGERMSLIQFGSRVDVYLSARAKIKVKLGDTVVGGESIIATFDEGAA
jgi:phosphatidylserine decarboxylase